jgi:peptidoglycan hydrolase-like protein with peptidoglycan-binding domain
MTEGNQAANWRLGQTSAWYETRGKGPATISTGRGDKGGVSYGEYQLSSKAGTAEEFLNQSAYKNDFGGLTPATEDFNKKWVEMSAHPEFVQAQHDFIKKSHYDPLVNGLKNNGVDLSDRGPAVQDAMWSTAVQYRNLGEKVFVHGLQAKFGQHPDLTNVTDAQIIEAVQDYKIAHVETLFSSSQTQWDSLRDRAKNEKADLMQFAETGVPIDTLARAAEQQAHGHHAQAHAAPAHGPALRIGDQGDSVNDLQTKLGQLGYTGPNGEPLVNNDKHFGQMTHDAVEAFQVANHLHRDGKAGSDTMRIIDTQLSIQAQAQGATLVAPQAAPDHAAPTQAAPQDAAPEQAAPQQAAPQQAARLDDSAHPDNALFLQARGLVHQLDRDQGRIPDQRSDNLAASLTVAARAEGMDRIDRIALSDDGSKMWAGQGLGNMRDHLVQFANVGTLQGVNTTMEQSSAQWPQAMQQFQLHQEGSQQQQQQFQQQAQQQAVSGMQR